MKANFYHIWYYPRGPSYTLTLIVNDACKVVDPKLGLVIVLGGNVVRVELVLGVELMQHGGVRALWEPRSTQSSSPSPPHPTLHQALLSLLPSVFSAPFCLSQEPPSLYLYPNTGALWASISPSVKWVNWNYKTLKVHPSIENLFPKIKIKQVSPP